MHLFHTSTIWFHNFPAASSEHMAKDASSSASSEIGLPLFCVVTADTHVAGLDNTETAQIAREASFDMFARTTHVSMRLGTVTMAPNRRGFNLWFYDVDCEDVLAIVKSFAQAYFVDNLVSV